MNKGQIRWLRTYKHPITDVSRRVWKPINENPVAQTSNFVHFEKGSTSEVFVINSDPIKISIVGFGTLNAKEDIDFEFVDSN
jgi:hypothetical protein